MPNIMTITLNPALDLSTVTETVRPGPKIRCAAPVVEPGGGGVNVSRTIRALGGRSLAVVCLGGTTGTRLLNRLEHYYGRFESLGFEAVVPEWEARSAMSGRELTVTGGGKTLAGSYAGIDEEGALLLKPSGQGEPLQRVLTGDVTIVGGYERDQSTGGSNS